MNDIFVRLVELPPTVHGFVMEDPGGDYNVYIRSADPEDLKEKTLEHELGHIAAGHLDQDCPFSAEKCEDVLKQENVDISTISRRQNRPFERLFVRRSINISTRKGGVTW